MPWQWKQLDHLPFQLNMTRPPDPPQLFNSRRLGWFSLNGRAHRRFTSGTHDLLESMPQEVAAILPTTASTSTKEVAEPRS